MEQSAPAHRCALNLPAFGSASFFGKLLNASINRFTHKFIKTNISEASHYPITYIFMSYTKVDVRTLYLFKSTDIYDFVIYELLQSVYVYGN